MNEADELGGLDSVGILVREEEVLEDALAEGHWDTVCVADQDMVGEIDLVPLPDADLHRVGDVETVDDALAVLPCDCVGERVEVYEEDRQPLLDAVLV